MKRLFGNRKAALIFTALILGSLGATALAQSSARGVSVTEIALAKVMVNGVPEEAVTSFSGSDERIYCFTRLQNTTRQETSVIIGFEPATGDPQPSLRGVRLTVPARWQYRTFARIPNNRPAGQYRCVVRNHRGQVLQHANYTVSE